jgi:hypothetical protein
MGSEGIPNDPSPGGAGSALGLRWPIKYSFQEYIGRMPDGRRSVTDGATLASPDEMLYELDPGRTSVTSVGELMLAFRGDVRFGGHFGLLFVRIADPWVTLRGGRAVMTVGHPYEAESRLRLVTFDASPQEAPPGLLGWSGTNVQLTEEGTELFNDVYEVGEPFEPLTIRVPGGERNVGHVNL